MAEEAQETAPAPQKNSALSLLATIGGVAAGIAIGVSVGIFVLGPKLAPANAAVHAPRSSDSTHEQEATVENKASEVPSPIYLIENLVLNPAGSNGTRFLLLSVAIAAKDEGTIERLKSRDSEIRDHILRLFGSKSVDQVWAASERDGLRKDVMAVLNSLFPAGSIKTVYFPQFVIQ